MQDRRATELLWIPYLTKEGGLGKQVISWDSAYTTDFLLCFSLMETFQVARDLLWCFKKTWRSVLCPFSNNHRSASGLRWTARRWLVEFSAVSHFPAVLLCLCLWGWNGEEGSCLYVTWANYSLGMSLPDHDLGWNIASLCTSMSYLWNGDNDTSLPRLLG